MSGRYGVDTLFYILISVSIVLSVINLFLRSYILQIFVYAFIIYAFFRVMSRNYSKRQSENRWFLSLSQKFRKKVDTVRQRRADVTHIYKKCPNCRATLRLPRRHGKHTTVCPKCNTSFKVRVR